MNHAEICPVCNGEGKVKAKQCHGCSGKGWVEVGQNSVPYSPPMPPGPYKPWGPYEPYPYRDIWWWEWRDTGTTPTIPPMFTLRFA